MTAAQAFIEIEQREIGLSGWRKRGLWIASVEIEDEGAGKPETRIESVIAGSPLAAVEALVTKLDSTALESVESEECADENRKPISRIELHQRVCPVV